MASGTSSYPVNLEGMERKVALCVGGCERSSFPPGASCLISPALSLAAGQVGASSTEQMFTKLAKWRRTLLDTLGGGDPDKDRPEAFGAVTWDRQETVSLDRWTGTPMGRWTPNPVR